MLGQNRQVYSKYDPRSCLPFFAPSNSTQKATNSLNLRKHETPNNNSGLLRSGKITGSFLGNLFFALKS